MTSYSSPTRFEHGEIPAVGVLFANLGTPDAPTPAALRRYLREFLSDPRVIELPRPLWWLILNVFVLPNRPRRSARLYERIWTSEGSPLLAMARRQAAALETRLRRRIASPLHVALGMRYGSPSIASALRELEARACRRILVFPAYPQYSATTTASTFDAVAAELSSWRWIPELRTVNGYHDDPGYVACLASSIREAWSTGGEPSRLMFSFHGLPRRYFDGGDPYFCLCQKTARLVVERLGLAEERSAVCFQSRFGREEWLRPYTDATLLEWAGRGLGRVDVVCPGFAADCLETLEEIAITNGELYRRAGGGAYRYLPALNDRADHVEALAGIAVRHLHGWVAPAESWDGPTARADADASRAR
ncbi:MAG: ferrochelatase, partial [Acidobacteriota bacterium]